MGLISRLMSPHSARVGKALASSELALCFYLCQNCHSVLIYLIFHCGYHDHTVCFVPYRLSSRLTEIFVGTGKSLCTHTKSSGEGQGGWDTVLQVCAQAERVTAILLLECCTTRVIGTLEYGCSLLEQTDGRIALHGVSDGAHPYSLLCQICQDQRTGSRGVGRQVGECNTFLGGR